MMMKRSIPCLDDYFDSVLIDFWAKFKFVIETNISSVKAALQNNSLVTSYMQEMKDFYVIHRYAELVASIKILMDDGLDNQDMLDKNISFIRTEVRRESKPVQKEKKKGKTDNQPNKKVDKLILSVASKFPKKKHKCTFIISCYNTIIATFEERKIKIDSTTNYVDSFEKTIKNYVEEELKEFFGKLVTMTLQAEPLLANSSSPEEFQKIVSTKELEQISREFFEGWKSNLKKIYDDVTKTFNSSDGLALKILKPLFTQLVLHYSVFTQLVGLGFSPSVSSSSSSSSSTASIPANIKKLLVSTSEIHYEISSNYIKND